MTIPRGTVGIDAGATLCKVVHHEETLRLERYSSADLERVRRSVARDGAARIRVTGGGADELGGMIEGVSLQHVDEFAAWARGAGILAAREGVELSDRYVLVSVGTGTSALLVEKEKVERAGGTALGGGTLLGLARLVLGVESFPELVKLSRAGNRRQVDLLVGDIYRTERSPLPVDLTASNFGKLASTDPPDLACALMGLLGENVALICSGVAARASAHLILYCGSTVSENPVLREILETVTRMTGRQARFLENGAYCGAVGAAAHPEE